jgi:hypothetical protein
MTRSDRISLPTTPHNRPKDLMPILQLINPLLKELPLPLRARRLSSNSLNLHIRHGINDNRREDILEAANNVAFNDLSGDVGYEGLLGNLEMIIRKCMEQEGSGDVEIGGEN